MNLTLIFLILIGLLPLNFAQARMCDSENTDFITSRPELACMACEMEFVDTDFHKEKAAEYGLKDPTQLKMLAGPTDRYWALISISARQFYPNSNGQMNDDDFKLAMIRMVSAMGPCRENYYDPSQEFLQQLKLDYENSATKKYHFPDLTTSSVDISEYAVTNDVTWKSSHESKEDAAESKTSRRSEQQKIANALGFTSYKSFQSLMKKPENFAFMTHEQLRSSLRGTFDNLPSGDDLFNKNKEGEYMRSCAKQIQTNLKSNNFFGPKASDVCERLTRSCFKKDSDSWVDKVCSQHGLTSLRSGKITTSSSSSDGKQVFGTSSKKSGKK